MIGSLVMYAVVVELIARANAPFQDFVGRGGPELYGSVGYQLAGGIPNYAQSADGTLHATAIYYRLLD